MSRQIVKVESRPIARVPVEKSAGGPPMSAKAAERPDGGRYKPGERLAAAARARAEEVAPRVTRPAPTRQRVSYDDLYAEELERAMSLIGI